MAKLPVPKAAKTPKVRRVYEDEAGGSYKAGHPQRIARPSVVPPKLPKVYEDGAGGSYKAGNPQRIARPSVAAMNRSNYRLLPAPRMDPFHTAFSGRR